MSREPVIITGLLIALIQAAVLMAQQLGWIELSNEQFAAVMAFVAALIAVGAFVVRRYTTPLSDPIDDDGEPLVRADRIPLLMERND